MVRTNGKIQLYPLVRIVAMLIIGIVIGGYLNDILSPLAWFSSVCLLIVAAFAMRRHCVAQGVIIMLAFIALGGYLITNAEKGLAVSLPEGEIEYEAVLVSEPVRRGRVVQMDIVIVGDEGGMKVKASLLRDTVEHRYESLHVGDGIRAYSQLEKPRNYQGATFDYARWLVAHGYRAQTFIYYQNWVKAAVDLRTLSLVERTKLAAMKTRRRVMERFKELGLNGQEYAVVSAVTLGDKSLIDKELRNNYSISGASHVLALSGLHLGIVYAVLSFLFMGIRRYWLPQLFILTAIWGYVFIAGMSPSVTRSAIMLTIYSFVGLLGRDRMSINTLAFAAIVMLLANPLNLYDIGFQLSFMAVLAILTITPLVYTFMPVEFLRRHRLAGWICGMAIVSVVAQIGTAPLVAYHFGQFPAYFLLTNFIAVPCTTLILYATVVFFLLMAFPNVQLYVVKAISWLADVMNNTLTWIAGLPGAGIDGIHISELQTLLLYVMICCTLVIVSYFRRDCFRRGYINKRKP